MSRINVEAERIVPARPDDVYAIVSDYRGGRPRILPPSFQDYNVEEGGQGEGTVFRYRLQAGRRERPYRIRVQAATPPRSLREADTGSSLVTDWILNEEGEGTRVRISTSWEGAGGIGGFFERTFAPMALRRVYEQTLERLAATLTTP